MIGNIECVHCGHCCPDTCEYKETREDGLVYCNTYGKNDCID